MDEVLAQAAREGFITARQALRLGSSYRSLNRLVAGGKLEHALHNVYLPTDRDFSDSGGLDERHSLLVTGILSEHPTWVASHHSALVLRGLPVWGAPRDRVHAAGPQRSSVVRGSVHLHKLLPDDPVVEVLGHPCLAPGFAAMQVAGRSGVAGGLVAADACVRGGLATAEDLAGLAASSRWHRGVANLRRVAELADGRAESPMESVLRLYLTGHGWEVEPQAHVGGPGTGYRVDLLIDGRVVVEYDGEEKYLEGGQRAVLTEKGREDHLRSRGYGFVRVVKAQLAYPTALRLVVGRRLAEHKANNAVPPVRC